VQTEHSFINQILAIHKQADVVVVGDLNDYQFSPALPGRPQQPERPI
jgi:uncharacterized protein